MVFRLAGTGIALLTASVLLAGAGAQTSLSGVSGPAKSVDLRTAPVLQSPPMPPIDFNRPVPPADHRDAQQRGTAQTQETPPDRPNGGR
jgi:hypothetical protein